MKTIKIGSLIFMLCVGVNNLSRAQETVPFFPEEEILEMAPNAGEGFRTEFLGEEVTVPSQDRRSINAWTAGMAFNKPAPSRRSVDPIASLYFWKHTDDDQLFYGDVAILYNSLFFAKKFEESESFEWVLTFENFTLPMEQEEIVDGGRDRDQAVLWGYVRPGFGVGYRKQVSPFHNDNMLAVDFTVEPGFLYFDGSNTGANFADPQDTFELRTKLEVRWDALTRNTLSLANHGFAMGADALWGRRFNWESWGINRENQGSDGSNYSYINGYIFGVGDVPFISSDRHRLIGSLHAGVGHNRDRFNHTPTSRQSGGINPGGMEYHTVSFPALPGAALMEFFPQHHVIGYGEYRYAATFFAFLSAYGGAAYLNPFRETSKGVRRVETVMPYVGGRVVTGFFGDTRLILDYAHNFGLKRKNDDFGGNQIVLSISGEF